ncbi:hypothetical protein [Streptomyces sp. NPDC088360]|uniref:hypothetical protein n=1 Tax=Streptomyces sp. NPDC088360 TaxID=3154515 RepID=UPI00345076FC
MIRLDHANTLPATNAAATIVAGGHAGNVDLVVAGDVLKENGVLKAGDSVFDEATASRDRLFHAAGLPLAV